MSVTHQSEDKIHARDEWLLPLCILGFIAITVVMGWRLFDHERPNMPRATVMMDAGTPRG
ncbi:MAG: hypothetical protein JSR78_05695 [Proteobacteria bacterium]|nr:hypothetical protein [Pseudomonadota bacterium]